MQIKILQPMAKMMRLCKIPTLPQLRKEKSLKGQLMIRMTTLYSSTTPDVRPHAWTLVAQATNMEQPWMVSHFFHINQVN